MQMHRAVYGAANRAKPVVKVPGRYVGAAEGRQERTRRALEPARSVRKIALGFAVEIAGHVTKRINIHAHPALAGPRTKQLIAVRECQDDSGMKQLEKNIAIVTHTRHRPLGYDVSH